MKPKFLIAIAVLTIGLGYSATGDAHSPGQNTGAPGMMGPGMMGQSSGGPATTPPGMSIPGPVGPGMMGPGMMGPGMMGPGMMGPGMMGPGMMGPGMMGFWSRGRRPDLSTGEARRILEGQLAMRGLKRLKVGAVEEKNKDTVTADIVTAKEGALVVRLDVDRHTGFSWIAD